MGGKRSRFRRNTLHHATISAHGINVVVEYLETRPIEMGGQPLLSDSHTHAGGDALPERTGRCLNARDPVVFRMSGCPTVELAETTNIVKGYRRLPQPLVININRMGLSEV